MSTGNPLCSDTPGPVAGAMAAGFGALSRLRSRRIFHPDGVGYGGVLRIDEPQDGYPGVQLLRRPGEHPAVVRFSRGGAG